MYIHATIRHYVDEKHVKKYTLIKQHKFDSVSYTQTGFCDFWDVSFSGNERAFKSMAVVPGSVYSYAVKVSVTRPRVNKHVARHVYFDANSIKINGPHIPPCSTSNSDTVVITRVVSKQNETITGHRRGVSIGVLDLISFIRLLEKKAVCKAAISETSGATKSPTETPVKNMSSFVPDFTVDMSVFDQEPDKIIDSLQSIPSCPGQDCIANESIASRRDVVDDVIPPKKRHCPLSSPLYFQRQSDHVRLLDDGLLSVAREVRQIVSLSGGTFTTGALLLSADKTDVRSILMLLKAPEIFNCEEPVALIHISSRIPALVTCVMMGLKGGKLFERLKVKIVSLDKSHIAKSALGFVSKANIQGCVLDPIYAIGFALFIYIQVNCRIHWSRCSKAMPLIEAALFVPKKQLMESFETWSVITKRYGRSRGPRVQVEYRLGLSFVV